VLEGLKMATLVSQSTPELDDSVFEAITVMTRDLAGISMNDSKKELVRSRLGKRLRSLGMNDFPRYLDLVRHDREELARMIDALTTNKTSFFRESRHFDVLTSDVLRPAERRGTRLRGWSAACSTGEEPYTIAMLIREHARGVTDARILATDISPTVLERAKKAEYASELVESVPEELQRRHFRAAAGAPGRMVVAPETRSLVRFAFLNLMEDWPFKGPFDFIFCRNVMIYFEKPLQEWLVNRMAGLLAPGGLLFIGLAESLTGLKHGYRFQEPGVYVK
jgi:chemotaxis protein methyltransferase CheR